MTTLCTVLVTDGGQETKAIEAHRVQRALLLAAQDIRAAAGLKTSGNLIDQGGATIGSWTLTGSATH